MIQDMVHSGYSVFVKYQIMLNFVDEFVYMYVLSLSSMVVL